MAIIKVFNLDGYILGKYKFESYQLESPGQKMPKCEKYI